MSDPEAEDVLTLAEAASELDVTPQRVSQLIGQRRLVGPAYPSDRKAPRNAPRVYRSSVEQYLARQLSRSAETSRLERLEAEVSALRSELAHLREEASIRERSLRDAAAELKAGAESLYDLLSNQLDRNAELAAEVASSRALLAAERERASATDRLRSALGDSLTSLLAPDSPRDL